MDNHDYTLSDEFTSISTFANSFDSNFQLKEGFDMDSIGLVGQFWDNKEEDKSFRLTYPVNRQIEAKNGTASLSWTKALYADRYEYAVYADAEMTNLVASGEVNAYENCADIAGLETGKQYYWTVTAVNDSKEMGGAWSSTNTGSFTVSSDDYEAKNVRFYNAEGEVISDMANFASASYMTYDIVNRTETAVSYDIIGALYRDNSVLKQMIAYNTNLVANPGTTSCRIDLKTPIDYTDGDYAFVFVWESGESINPLIDKIIIE